MTTAKRVPLAPLLALVAGITLPGNAPAQTQQKPNIVVFWGDDIGQTNISAYSKGLMGYRTPTSTASPARA
jgi:arylsulfatase